MPVTFDDTVRAPSAWFGRCHHCRSYSPLLTFFKTVNPAFLASLTYTGFRCVGVLNRDRTFRTGFRQAGHCVNGAADSGRRSVNLPPQAAQFPSQSSYS